MKSNEITKEKTSKTQHVPGDKYVKLLLRVSNSPAVSGLLRLFSTFAVVFSVFVLALTVTSSDLPRAIELAAIMGVPFVAVSIVRRLINAPRPYELLNVYETPPKSKKGESFPSRHVFSIFIIATVAIPTYPILASALVAAGVVLAASRVLLGIHFLRDVVAGALVGMISGGVGLLILYLI